MLTQSISSHDVAIIGMSCIFPKANNLREYWSNNVNGVDAVVEKPARRWPTQKNWTRPRTHESFLPCSKAGFLSEGVFLDPVKFGIVPNLVRHGDPDQFFMIACIDMALRDAKIAADAPIRERTDVIVGRGGYASMKMIELGMRAELFEDFVEILDRKYPGMFDGRREEIEKYLFSTLTPLPIDNVSTAVSNIAASRPANRFNLRGASYVVDGACASSLLAVESGIWRLRTGQSDMVVAGGLFVSMNPSFFYIFNRLGGFSESQMIRPFDRRADGLMVGEGGGAVILKRLEDAIRDRDQIYAVIKGVGSSSDGIGLDVLAPNSQGQILAIDRAYRDAGVDRSTISYLEAHGTGTLAGDEAEVASIKAAFGTQKEPATARAMGSVKSMIGHTMPGAGMASIIRVAMSLSNKILPPSLHCEEPREDLADAPFYVNTQTRPWVQATKGGPRRAGVNAFGFGGVNVHVVMEETPTYSPTAMAPGFDPVPRPIEPGLARASELAPLTASSVKEMQSRIQTVLHFSLNASAPLADICYTLVREVDLHHPVKAAVVAREKEELVDLLRQLLEGIQRGESFEKHENIYYSPSATKPPGKIAFVLPGMGFPGLIGNYPDHLLELALHFPDIREEFDFFEERDRHPEDTVPTSSIFSPPSVLPEAYRKQLKGRLAPPKADSDFSKENAPHERYLAAMGVTLANWVSWVLLRKFKIPVDMMTGQSQGEMAAICACGCADFHETAPRFWKFLDVDTRDKIGGRLAFAWAPSTRIDELTAQFPGTYIAIYMAPVGVIFGGDRAGLEQICEILRQEEVLVQILPYPPIHTPSLAFLKEDLNAKLGDDDLFLKPPQIPLYSSITSDLYPSESDAIREHLMYNVDRPLRIWQTIQRMYVDGARVFVQVGGGHMAAHLEMFLPENAEPVVTAATDTDVRNPITQINHVCAKLLTAGVPLDLSALFECRSPQTVSWQLNAAEQEKKGLLVPLRLDWMPSYNENVPPARNVAPTASPADATAPNRQEPSIVATAEDPLPASPETDLVDLRHLLPFEAAVLDRLPVLGRVTHYVPGEEVTVERLLSLENDIYLEDHVFVYAPKPTAERLPVLPMTMSLEFLAEVASFLAPGEGLVGFENIRAMKWISLKDRPIETIRIEAKLQGVHPTTGVRKIAVRFYTPEGLAFQANALFSTTLIQEINFNIVDSSQDGPWPIEASQLYGERYTFHGPAFQVMPELDTFGNPGASTKLEVPPKDKLFANLPDPILLTDPCLMDGIGHIVGLWAYFAGAVCLPNSTERIEFYGPTPPVGTRLPTRMECYELNFELKQVRAHVEIEDGQGNVWVRVQGWSEWITTPTFEYTETTRMPGWYHIASELPLPGLPESSLCMQLHQEHLMQADPEWMGMFFLHASEIPEYKQITERKKSREFIRHRLVAKDAARVWLARRDQTPGYTHPCEWPISHDALGAPHFEPAGDPALPHLSLSHTGLVSLALVAPYPVGIDFEAENRPMEQLEGYFLTDQESERLQPLVDAMPDEAWPLRFWCAKEALGKMLGIGLEGRPKQFEVVDVQTTSALILEHRTNAQRYEVQTIRWNGFVYAYCSAASASENVLSAPSALSEGSASELAAT